MAVSPPIDFKHPGHSAAMAAATVAAFLLTPPTKTFVDGMSSQPMWVALQHRLLPHDKWFGLISLPIRVAAPAVSDPSGITTGSLPANAPAPAIEAPAAVR